MAATGTKPDEPTANPGDQPKPKRLVLCFDGTGNKFLGNEADTNIVKIYQRLDRHDPDQYHYYQRERPLMWLESGGKC